MVRIVRAPGWHRQPLRVKLGLFIDIASPLPGRIKSRGPAARQNFVIRYFPLRLAWCASLVAGIPATCYCGFRLNATPPGLSQICLRSSDTVTEVITRRPPGRCPANIGALAGGCQTNHLHSKSEAKSSALKSYACDLEWQTYRALHPPAVPALNKSADRYRAVASRPFRSSCGSHDLRSRGQNEPDEITHRPH